MIASILTATASLNAKAETNLQSKSHWTFNVSREKVAWREAVGKTQKYLELNPRKKQQLEERIFEKATSDIQILANTNFNISSAVYVDFTDGDLADICRSLGSHAEKAMELASRLKYSAGITNVMLNASTVDRFMGGQVTRLSERASNLEVLKEYDIVDKDCRAVSTVAAAVYMKLLSFKDLGNNEMEMVGGIVYDNSLSPNGDGHVWVKIDGTIREYSFDKSPSTGYIPLMAVKMKKVKSKVILTPKIYCLPKDLLDSE